jgi:hypothetical protein
METRRDDGQEAHSPHLLQSPRRINSLCILATMAGCKPKIRVQHRTSPITSVLLGNNAATRSLASNPTPMHSMLEPTCCNEPVAMTRLRLTNTSAQRRSRRGCPKVTKWPYTIAVVALNQSHRGRPPIRSHITNITTSAITNAQVEPPTTRGPTLGSPALPARRHDIHPTLS